MSEDNETKTKTLKQFSRDHDIMERREPLKKEYWKSHRLLKNKSISNKKKNKKNP